MNITSLQNPLIQHLCRLRKEKAYREEKKTFVLLGQKLIEECPLPIQKLLYTSKISKESYIVTEEMLKKIAGINFDGWIAEVSLPEEKMIEHPKRILILDEIQDPSNMGSLLRSALAFGWDQIIKTPGSSDFFNDKVIRSSSGAILKHNFCTKTEDEILAFLEEKKVPLLVGDMKGKTLNETTLDSLALVLSHEGGGVRPWAEKKGQKISIPFSKKVESLNVNAAGAILLYTLRGSF